MGIYPLEKYPLKLQPIIKSAIWGEERWMLSVRSDGNSIIENGIYKDMPLSEYLNIRDGSFPLLVKFIDAKDKLSIQVHPDKFELWYIVTAVPKSKIVYGFKGKYDIETIRNGNIEELANYKSVKPGGIYNIPAGLVHAAGAGLLIAEVQQNFNTTYRLYDYNRGRDLHIGAALDTIKHFKKIKNNYFIVNVHEGEVNIKSFETFKHILCIGGNGWIDDYEINTGDSYFIPQNFECKIKTEHGIKILESY
ncbi:MAG: class I mannose-6-phosphate isomerase [Oscillospiraceae bacterium]|nr:class I mannose-6-phosphate isomerase [Oscillospiraceae bacterium]